MNNALTAQVESVGTKRRAHRQGLMHSLMLLTTVCWASNMVAVKAALHGFGPLALAQLRVLGAAIVLLIIFSAWRKRPALRLARGEWGLMAVLALTGVVFNQLFFIMGLSRTSVAHAGLIVALGPIMVLVLACLMRLEPLTVLKFAGMLVSFAGVAILTTGKLGQGNGGHWQGDLIVLGGGAVFAYYTIRVKKVADRFHTLTLNALSYAMGALLLAPVGTRAVVATRWNALTLQIGWAVAYIVVFGSVVPYTIYAFAMTELAASRVAAFNYLQPVITTALGIWLLAEKLSLSVVIGGALILLGVFLTEREPGEERR